MRYVSPWYNRTGWLGVKHQLTYLLRIFILEPSSFSLQEETWGPVLVLRLELSWCWTSGLWSPADTRWDEYSILLLLSPLLIFRMSAKSTLETVYCAGLVSVIRSVFSEELGCKQFLWLDTCLFVTACLIHHSYSVADHVMQWMLYLFGFACCMIVVRWSHHS